MQRFEGKVVLITGGASGIGEATAYRMAEEGAKIVIGDRNKENAEKLIQSLHDKGFEAHPVYFSALDLDSCKALVDSVTQRYGRIDVLVNNVGGNDLKRDGNVEHIDISYFDQLFQLNLRCTIYLTQQVLPFMARQQQGNIVNVASISGITADYQGTLYGASKAAVINFTQYVATQYGRKGIRCNAVAPGLVLTPAALRNLPETMRNIFLRESAVDYLGEPKDIAATIAFLASDDARYITGQTIVADGGLTIHNPTVSEFMKAID